jgi:hypothetical protein
MKVGDLVKYKGNPPTLGVIVATKVTKRWSYPGDVWVLWSNERKPVIQSSNSLEVISESRRSGEKP